MNQDDDSLDQLSAYSDFAEAFNQDDDPLSEFDNTFKSVNQDPIELYINTKIWGSNITEGTKIDRERRVNNWKEYMDDYDRHPACPGSRHVIGFIDALLARELSRQHINKYLNTLSNMFEYWSDHPKMPHGSGDAMGYNPIDFARTYKEDDINAVESSSKSQHPMSVEELGHQVRSIKNVLHTAVIGTQFKYGLRGGQVCNIMLSDVKIQHDGLNDLYSSLGTHQRISDFEDDVIYFPKRSERPGVKSKRPIVMPLDTETRRLLINYLRQRPPVDEPWLFISNSSGNKLNTELVNKLMWRPNFRPEYDETDQYSAITSHYGRHRFSTYWRKEIGTNREYIKYMRGDKQGELGDSSDILNNYIHTYYTDIKDLYLSKIYNFGV